VAQIKVCSGIEWCMQACISSHLRNVRVDIRIRSPFGNNHIDANISCEIKDLTTSRSLDVNRDGQYPIAVGAIEYGISLDGCLHFEFDRAGRTARVSWHKNRGDMAR
jgi:hypothetical protein